MSRYILASEARCPPGRRFAIERPPRAYLLIRLDRHCETSTFVALCTAANALATSLSRYASRSASSTLCGWVNKAASGRFAIK